MRSPAARSPLPLGGLVVAVLGLAHVACGLPHTTPFAHHPRSVFPSAATLRHALLDRNHDHDTPNHDDSVTVVAAGVVIPGRGQEVKDGAVVFFNANGTIVYAGAAGGVPAGLNITRKFDVDVLMPGMWDVHTHFMGTFCANLPEAMGFNDLALGYAPHKYEAFACALLQLKEALCAGVTSVRELGGTYGQAIKHITESGLVPAPHFHFAGKFIGITGGHTDEQYLPVDIVRHDYDQRLETPGTLCDGTAECTQKVREQLRRQADVIKIMTTGGVLSAFDQPTDQEFSLEEVKAMVAEATRARRAVAAHAHGLPGIVTAVEGGVTSIEHGSYMNTTVAQMAKDNGMIHVPTITICQTFNKTEKPPEYDDLQWAKGVEVLEHNSEAVRISIATGLPIATGTDCPGDCAQVGQEITYLNKLFGMTPLEAIECGTANGPLALSIRGENTGFAPLSGQLRKGFVADLIALSESPLDDVAVLTDPDKITHVWKAGRLFKEPGNHVCDNARTNPQVMEWMPTDE